MTTAAATKSKTWLIDHETDSGIVFIRSAEAREPDPADWKSRMIRAIQRHPRVGLVGAKRLAADGTVHSMGEFLVHPKGFHHTGTGERGISYRFPQEVDAICSGVAAVSKAIFDEVHGEDLCRGELGLVALSLAIREAGYRVLAIPSVCLCDETTPCPDDAEESAFHNHHYF